LKLVFRGQEIVVSDLTTEYIRYTELFSRVEGEK
jgi:hypothetical protein